MKKINYKLNLHLFVFILSILFSLSSFAQRIGIYTGTFDPPHTAHQTIVEKILKGHLVDEVYVVPDDKTNFKPNKSPLIHRIAMLKIMFKGQDNVKFLDPSISDLIKSGEMWNVYKVIKDYAKPQETFLIMGADTFLKYRDFSSNFYDHNFALAVVSRGKSIQIPERIGNQKIYRIEIDMDDVSSTKIRDALQKRKFVKELSPEVFKYIETHGLYNFPLKSSSVINAQ